jgi:hypothetical protein
MNFKKILFLIIQSLFILNLSSQEVFTISGHVKDADTGEDLIGATVYIKDLNKGIITNVYGYYSIRLSKGKHVIGFSYLGYESQELELDVNSSITKEIELVATSLQIEEVVVSAERKDANVESLKMSVEKIDMKRLEKLPSFMGEPDVLKAVALLPGVQTGGEGSAGIYVRGGSADQNLILLDEATVYNPQHFGGFFSVFNQDIVKNMEVYKGGIPAEYGGRLSSLIDIRMKEGNMRKYEGSASIGNIASKFTLQGPIQTDEGSFILAARRSYFDLFFGLSSDQGVKDSEIYFYDINLKANYKFGENDRIFLSAFRGADFVGFRDIFSIGWRNTTATLRWNHLFSDQLFLNTTLLYSLYDYELNIEPTPSAEFHWVSDFSDINLKFDFNYFYDSDNTIKFGLNTMLHEFHMGELIPGPESNFASVVTPEKNAIESAIYAEDEQKVTDKFSLRYGLRFTLFNQIGESTEYEYQSKPLNEDKIIGVDKYESFDLVETFTGWEPRISMKYTLAKSISLKASFNRTIQYLHLITTSNSPTPLDIWVPSTKHIDPEYADQFVVGYFQNFMDDEIELSTELYYKNMKNQIDFIPNAEPLLNDHIETEIRTGDAYSYGIEFSLKKKAGDFTGSLSYTYSKTRRKIPEINQGKEYSPDYDRPHDLKFQGVYQFNEHWDFGATWQFTSGKPATFPDSKYAFSGHLIQTYELGGRNSFRLDPFHRLDLSANYNFSPKIRKGFRHNMNISLVNVYMRKNPYSVYFRINDKTGKPEAIQLSILGILVPSLTYSVKF